MKRISLIIITIIVTSTIFGRIIPEDGQKQWRWAIQYIHDHQGNVRQVVNAATGYVAQENHYYPGGMLFAENTALFF